MSARAASRQGSAPVSISRHGTGDPNEYRFGLIKVVREHVLCLANKATAIQRTLIDLIISETLAVPRKPRTWWPEYATIPLAKTAKKYGWSKTYLISAVTDLENAGIVKSISPAEARELQFAARGKERWYKICPENWAKAPTLDERKPKPAPADTAADAKPKPAPTHSFTLRPGAKPFRRELPPEAREYAFSSETALLVDQSFTAGVLTFSIAAAEQSSPPVRRTHSEAQVRKNEPQRQGENRRSNGEGQVRKNEPSPAPGSRQTHLSAALADVGLPVAPGERLLKLIDTKLGVGEVTDFIDVLREQLRDNKKKHVTFELRWLPNTAKIAGERAALRSERAEASARQQRDDSDQRSARFDMEEEHRNACDAAVDRHIAEKPADYTAALSAATKAVKKEYGPRGATAAAIAEIAERKVRREVAESISLPTLEEFAAQRCSESNVLKNGEGA